MHYSQPIYIGAVRAPPCLPHLGYQRNMYALQPTNLHRCCQRTPMSSSSLRSMYALQPADLYRCCQDTPMPSTSIKRAEERVDSSAIQHMSVLSEPSPAFPKLGYQRIDA